MSKQATSVPETLSLTKLQSAKYEDVRLQTVLNAAFKNLTPLRDPFYSDTISTQSTITSDLNKKCVEYAFQKYKKFKLRWGDWDNSKYETENSSTLAATLQGKFEFLSHWYPLRTAFQHVFSDPIFRVMESGNALNDFDTVTISKFEKNFTGYIDSIKESSDGGKILFKRMKFFAICFFANQKDAKDDEKITDDEFKSCLSDIRQLSSKNKTETDKTIFMQFHFLILYILAYKAYDIDDLQVLVKRNLYIVK